MAQGPVLTPKWRHVEVQNALPKPRHGHRAVTIRDMMIVFGGGSEGIIDNLHIFRTSSNQWATPSCKGEIPPGCAAFGFCTDGVNRVFLCGGMLEFGKYSNDIYELKISTFDWKKITARKPKNAELPRPRLGHSFTMIGTKLYLFGGLANSSENPRDQIPHYLNDLYTIEIKSNSATQQWECPVTHGEPPCPRESHSASAYTAQNGAKKLLIYGGMNGQRLGDLFILDIGSMTWSQPKIHGIPPMPRSLHSATVINRKLYIFGGWIRSETMNDSRNYFKCSNALSIFNLDTMTWELSSKEAFDDRTPRPRAGHVCTAVGTRMYLWSGRDGFRKLHQTQFCYPDLWYLETDLPSPPASYQLRKASLNALDLSWFSVANAECYIVQIMKTCEPLPSEEMLPPSVNLTPVPVSGQPFATMTSTASQPFIPDPSVYAAAKKLCLPDTTSPIISQIPVAVSHNPVSVMSPQPMISINPVSCQNVVTKQTVAQSKTQSGVSQPIASHMPTSTISSIQNVPGQPLVGIQALAAAAAEQTVRSNAAPKIVHIQQTSSPQIQSHPQTPQTIPQPTQQTGPSTVRIVSPQTFSAIVRPAGSNMITVATSHPGSTPLSIQTPVRLITSTQHIGNFEGKPMIVKSSTSGHKISGTIKANTPIIKVLAKPGEILQNPIVSGGDPTLLNRSGNVGRIISTGPGPLKMLVLPSTSATTPNSGIIQTGKLRPVGQKVVQVPKGLNIRHFAPAGRLVSANGSMMPRFVFQSSTQNTVQTTPRPVVPVVPTIPSTSDVDMMIDNQTAPPEEISTVIPQMDGADNDIIDLEEKPQTSEKNDNESNDANNSVSIPVDQENLNRQSLIKPEDPSEKTEPIPSAVSVPTPTPIANSTPVPTPIPVPSTPSSIPDPSPPIIPETKLPINLDTKPPSPPKRAPPHCDGKWFDVGIVRTPKCNVIGYYIPPGDYDPERMFDSTNLPIFDDRNKFPLESGTRYKIRIAGVNQLGRGPWGDEHSFETYTPGNPSAPTQVRINKLSDGKIQLTWASNKLEEITEYTVMIAVSGDPSGVMGFEKVYCGKEASCEITPQKLSQAKNFKDQEKNNIYFRLSAKNARGVGQQTQVKWVADILTHPNASTPLGMASAKKRPFPNE